MPQRPAFGLFPRQPSLILASSDAQVIVRSFTLPGGSRCGWGSKQMQEGTSSCGCSMPAEIVTFMMITPCFVILLQAHYESLAMNWLADVSIAIAASFMRRSLCLASADLIQDAQSRRSPSNRLVKLQVHFHHPPYHLSLLVVSVSLVLVGMSITSMTTLNTKSIVAATIPDCRHYQYQQLPSVSPPNHS